MAAEYVTLPEWTYPESGDRSIYAFATALAVTDNENRWLKLTADQQRIFAGRVLWGRQSVGLFDGQLLVSRTVCFGTDRNMVPVTADDWNTKQKIEA